jgi:hypothetical protein
VRVSGLVSRGEIGEKEWCNVRVCDLGFAQLY